MVFTLKIAVLIFSLTVWVAFIVIIYKNKGFIKNHFSILDKKKPTKYKNQLNKTIGFIEKKMPLYIGITFFLLILLMIFFVVFGD